MLSCSTISAIVLATVAALMCTIDLQNAFKTWMCEASSNEVVEYSQDTESRLQDMELRLKRLEKKDEKAQKYISDLKDDLDQLQKEFQEVTDIVSASRVEKLPRDCEEILSGGKQEDGVYYISPDGRCPFQVYCDMKNGGWTIMQRRIDGSVNFYRPWDEYVAGFGDVNGEYWLGLDKIHRLTKDGSQIYFDIQNYDNTKDFAHYLVFTVHGASTAYKMNIDPFGYKGTIEENFGYHDNQKFSTYDRDNDNNAGNCCQTLDGGGWWYNSCYRLGNVNGVFGKKAHGGIGYWTTTNFAIRNVVIKLKRIPDVC